MNKLDTNSGVTLDEENKETQDISDVMLVSSHMPESRHLSSTTLKSRALPLFLAVTAILTSVKSHAEKMHRFCSRTFHSDLDYIDLREL